MITAQQIKELRKKTGAGVSDVKRALEESGGDAEKARAALERKLGSSAAKRAGRATSAGLIEAYIHGGRVGSMVEVLCETDFVARNPAFKELAHDIAMHIAAMRPLYLSLDAVPEDVVRAERERAEAEVAALKKPPKISGEIVQGKLAAYFSALSLLDQKFIKDEDKAVRDVVNEAIGKFGENITIGRFTRFEI